MHSYAAPGEILAWSFFDAPFFGARQYEEPWLLDDQAIIMQHADDEPPTKLCTIHVYTILARTLS